MSPQSQPNSKDSASGSDEAGSVQRQALPFEPKNRKPAAKAAAQSLKNQPVKKTPIKSGKLETAPSQRGGNSSGIPESVSRRMVWRMALFCGIPSALGMLTFIVSYLLVNNDILLPTYAVFLVSLGWFGIGVLGLSYGVLSASWDEEVAGSRLGWTEFATNVGRMRENWRLNAEQAKAAKAEQKKSKSGEKS